MPFLAGMVTFRENNWVASRGGPAERAHRRCPLETGTPAGRQRRLTLYAFCQESQVKRPRGRMCVGIHELPHRHP